MRTIEDIVSDIIGLVNEAHEIGVREGAAFTRSSLASFLATPIPPDADANGRLRVGTVKPEIIRLVNEAPSGLTLDEVIAMTGFKANSVRGTLYHIERMGLIAKRAGRYFPKAATPDLDSLP